MIRGTMLALACVAMAGCAGHGDVSLAIDGRANANVTLAADADHVFAAWAASAPQGGTDIYLAASSDNGRTFGAPVRVNPAAGDASASGEQPPRVTTNGHEVDVFWVSKASGAPVIRAARSLDGGRTFERAVNVTPEGLGGARGWQSADVSSDGVVHAAWLDGRNAAGIAGAMQHDHMAMTPAGDPRQDIFAASWRAGEPPVETRVATNVCFCCKTAVASRGHDVYVAWRHLYDGGVRDIAVARSSDDGRTFSDPVRVSADDWHINACPDDGPALAIDTDGAVHVVWPTMVKDPDMERIAIFHAVSRDGGRAFSPRERVDGARGTAPAHPRIALSGGDGVVVVWDELTQGHRQVAMRRLNAADAGSAAVEVLTKGGSAVYPSVVQSGDRLVVAWTEFIAGSSRIVVRRLPSP